MRRRMWSRAEQRKNERKKELTTPPANANSTLNPSNAVITTPPSALTKLAASPMTAMTRSQMPRKTL